MSVALATWREHALRPLQLMLGAILIAASMLTASAAGVIARADAASAAKPPLTLSLPTVSTFVPDWDGEEDSTRITVHARASMRVAVEVQTTGGVVVRTLFRGRLVGARNLYWNGRGANNVVVAASKYRFVARRIGLGLHTRKASLRASARVVRSITLAEPDMSIASLSLTRGLLSRVAGRNSTVIKYRLTAPGSVSAAIADPNGDIVRQLAVGHSKAGTSTLVWNGRSSTGAQLADGSYELLISASSGGHMPTNTQSAPLRIDTQAPAISTAGRLLASLVKGHITVPLAITAGEGGAVRIVGSGGHSYATTMLVGAHSFPLPGSALGLVARTRAVTSTVTISVTDDAGNSTVKHVRVVVPARTTSHHTTTAPTPVAPPPTTTTGTGRVPTLIWPTAGCYSSDFGPRGTGFHYGIDLASPIGTIVHAAASGIVGYAGTMSGYGNIVIIQHPGGSSTRYAHLSRIDVVVGQTVTQGIQIALSGNTGHSTGPHLHFEVRIDDVAHDPMGYLPPAGRPVNC